jgi:tRNA dimethylallyltransferase
MAQKDILVLMGATGTGKSALARAVAKSRPTVIINADAMQLVGALRILTARPSAGEEAEAEHALYGVLPAEEGTSVARWLALVKPAIESAWNSHKLPLLVGGTGMYIKALMDGLTEIPEIPADIRERIRAMPKDMLHSVLEGKDPAMAAKLKPGDSQRLRRALEVIEATGTSIGEWQLCAATPLFPEARYHCFTLELPRAELYARLDARFRQMVEAGAVDEVRALLALDLPPGLPILRATGVPEIAAYLRGEVPLEKAIGKAQQSTRNYAKRQMTWLRNQMQDAAALPAARARAEDLLRF